MQSFYGTPRYILTLGLVKFFTGEVVAYEALREFGERLTGC
jgi:hypothetical protein